MMQCMEAKTDEDILKCFSVMKFLRPHLEEGAFLEKRSFGKAYFCQCRSTCVLQLIPQWCRRGRDWRLASCDEFVLRRLLLRDIQADGFALVVANIEAAICVGGRSP
jgi:hypothetical protein